MGSVVFCEGAKNAHTDTSFLFHINHALPPPIVLCYCSVADAQIELARVSKPYDCNYFKYLVDGTGFEPIHRNLFSCCATLVLTVTLPAPLFSTTNIIHVLLKQLKNKKYFQNICLFDKTPYFYKKLFNGNKSSYSSDERTRVCR